MFTFAQYINPAAKPKEVTPKLLAKAAGSGGTSATKTVSPKPMPNYPPAIQVRLKSFESVFIHVVTPPLIPCVFTTFSPRR